MHRPASSTNAPRPTTSIPGIVAVLKTGVQDVARGLEPVSRAEVDGLPKRDERTADRTVTVECLDHHAGVVRSWIGAGLAGAAIDRADETLVLNGARCTVDREALALLERVVGTGHRPSVLGEPEVDRETVGGLIDQRAAGVERLVDADDRVVRHAVRSGDRGIGDVVDRLVDDAGFGSDRIDAIRETLQRHRRPVLGDRRGLSAQHGELPAVALRPVDRGAGGDENETQMSHEHPAARPIVLVGEGPFGAAEVALAHLPAARREEGGDALARALGVAGDVHRRVQRNRVDLDRVQARDPARNHFGERRRRHRAQNQPDHADVRRAVVDVVEVEPHDRPRDRRRVRARIKRRVFPLLDDDADEREQPPDREQRHAERDMREQPHGLVPTLAQRPRGRRCYTIAASRFHRFSMKTMSQIETSNSTYIGAAMIVIVTGLPSGASTAPATSIPKPMYLR